MEVNICVTCLSENRKMTPLQDIRNLLQELNIAEIVGLLGGVCWECLKIMTKFAKFKLQIKKAQEAMNTQNKRKQCFSTLAIENKVHYFNYHLYHNLDPLTSVDENKINIFKEEDSTNEIDIYIESDYEEKPLAVDSVTDSNAAVLNKDQICNLITVENIKNEKHLFGYKTKRFKSFKTKDGLKEKEVKDKFCVIVFTVEEMLKNREVKRNQPNFKKIPFKCDSCVLGFTREASRDLHITEKHAEKIGKYMCDVCETRFPSKKPLERHCKKHFVCYKCKLCKYETVVLWSAYNHCRNKHSADKLDSIHCQQCTSVFRTPEELSAHTSEVHTLHCNQCGEKFKGKNTLRTHKLRIHGVKREFVCEVCTKTFKTKSRLESHTSTHGPTIAQKLAYCAKCGVQYKNIHVYRNHLRNSSAHSPYAYSCPECKKKFASKVYWNKHYNFYHLRKSQYTCEICNKLFISDWRLKSHRQKHHGLSRSRDHPCNVCGKKFFTQSTLRDHKLTHSEHRSYMCEDCGDTFKQRPALYNHSRLVHKGAKKKK